MTDLSFWSLIASASLVVKIVMLVLVGLSIISWMIIFQRKRVLRDAREGVAIFERHFWSGIALNQLSDDLRNHTPTGLPQIFQAGYREFKQLREITNIEPPAIVENVQRAMNVSLSKQAEILHTHQTFLATVGSVTPYIGLFGTVWGIMGSFRALGSVQQATLNMVAPGIAEALIATAMGLFAAIPAVMAYNRYNTRITQLLNQYENFQDEFLCLLQRQVYSVKNPSAPKPSASSKPFDNRFAAEASE